MKPGLMMQKLDFYDEKGPGITSKEAPGWLIWNRKT